MSHSRADSRGMMVNTPFIYMAMWLSEESGEILRHARHMMRDGYLSYSELSELLSEMQDAYGCLKFCAEAVGSSIESIATGHHLKYSDRSPTSSVEIVINEELDDD